MDPLSSREEGLIVETPLNFLSSSGLLTPAILAEPSTPTHLGVILCHGFLSDKQSRTNRRLTELLIPQGITTLGLEHSSAGHRSGQGPAWVSGCGSHSSGV